MGYPTVTVDVHCREEFMKRFLFRPLFIQKEFVSAGTFT
jgi:hypothetical protein